MCELPEAHMLVRMHLIELQRSDLGKAPSARTRNSTMSPIVVLAAGCVWSTLLGNGELEFFGKGTADHHNAHERLILIR